MLEIRNGRTKRMIALLAQESTLELLRALRPGGWYSLEELAGAVALDKELLRGRLRALEELGIVSSHEEGTVRFRLCNPRIRLEMDLRELPPGPGYILDVVRFYLRLLTNILDRCREVGGSSLQDDAREAIARMRLSLPDRERALLVCLREGTDLGGCLRALENRILAGELTDADLEWVRATYLATLRSVMDRLGALVDDSLGKLLFRLASRDLIREGADLAGRFSLLEGIPEKYLKQVELSADAY